MLLARLGKPDSRALDGYVADGGYASWKKVLAGVKSGEWTPAKVTDLVKSSELPRSGRRRLPHRHEVVLPPAQEHPAEAHLPPLNADESEPGTFKDRCSSIATPTWSPRHDDRRLGSTSHAYIYIRGRWPRPAS